MLKLFIIFKKIQIGSYTTSIREQERPTKHLIFIGQKEQLID